MGLKRRGHEVSFLVYHPHDHFLSLLESANIPSHTIPPCSLWQRALAVRGILRQSRRDVVLAFLEGPSLYAELAGIPRRSWALVVGERLASPRMISGRGRWLRQMHRLADAVVANSHTSRLLLEAGLPFLRGKLVTVYNAVDLQLFQPHTETAPAGGATPGPFRIVVAASYQSKKNLQGLARALLLLKMTSAPRRVVVDWYGAMPADHAPHDETKCFVAQHNLADSLQLHPPTKAIAQELSTADAVGLFSFFEGLPNVVCEGMASGKPILLSNTCDASHLVSDGRNGFLCDPSSAESIAAAIRRLVLATDAERQQMGLESRRMAERLFAQDIVVDRYERVLKSVVRRQPLASDCNWPTEVPESALLTVAKWTSHKTLN